jgi:hypothetical protein
MGGLVFTCLNCRAIHVELLESLDASAFICALRRFIAIRGPVRKIRCDRGTNFISGKTELTDALKEMDEGGKTYLTEQGCEWLFNPPHGNVKLGLSVVFYTLWGTSRLNFISASFFNIH